MTCKDRGIDRDHSIYMDRPTGKVRGNGRYPARVCEACGDPRRVTKMACAGVTWDPTTNLPWVIGNRGT